MPATLTLMQAYLSTRSKLRGIKPTDIKIFSRMAVRFLFSIAKPWKRPNRKQNALAAESSNQFFSFPGTQHLHFSDPSNNEFTVWSGA